MCLSVGARGRWLPRVGRWPAWAVGSPGLGHWPGGPLAGWAAGPPSGAAGPLGRGPAVIDRSLFFERKCRLPLARAALIVASRPPSARLVYRIIFGKSCAGFSNVTLSASLRVSMKSVAGVLRIRHRGVHQAAAPFGDAQELERRLCAVRRPMRP